MAYDSIQLQNAMQQIPMAYQQPYATQDTARYAAQDTTGYAAQQAPINFGAGAQVEEKKSGLSLGKVLLGAAAVVGGIAAHKSYKVSQALTEAGVKEGASFGNLFKKFINPTSWFGNETAAAKLVEKNGFKLLEEGKGANRHLVKQGDDVFILTGGNKLFKANGEADEVATNLLTKVDDIVDDAAKGATVKGDDIAPVTANPVIQAEVKVGEELEKTIQADYVKRIKEKLNQKATTSNEIIDARLDINKPRINEEEYVKAFIENNKNIRKPQKIRGQKDNFVDNSPESIRERVYQNSIENQKAMGKTLTADFNSSNAEMKRINRVHHEAQFKFQDGFNNYNNSTSYLNNNTPQYQNDVISGLDDMNRLNDDISAMGHYNPFSHEHNYNFFDDIHFFG